MAPLRRSSRNVPNVDNNNDNKRSLFKPLPSTPRRPSTPPSRTVSKIGASSRIGFSTPNDLSGVIGG